MPSFAKSLSLHRDIQPFAEYAVTPFVGVWIETVCWLIIRFVMTVTPFVGVWIETGLTSNAKVTTQSHPSWVCGLKQLANDVDFASQIVTPFVGVWIETSDKVLVKLLIESHPSWVCGLKQKSMANGGYLIQVTPFVGVWIETSVM